MPYIATDRDGWMAIYGIGESPAATIEDARHGAGPDAEFDTLPATEGLAAAASEHGGAPGDVMWRVVDGIAEVA